MRNLNWFFYLVVILCILAFVKKPVEKPGEIQFVTDTLAKNLTVPWDIVFLPSGDMLFTERAGRLRIYRNNKLDETPLITLDDVEINGKMGLLGMCLHPDFKINHQLYLAYNYKSENQTFVRIVRYTYENNKVFNRKLILENIPGVFNHTGTRLAFGPDKKLYITTGDADIPRLAQDLKVYNGKILRLNDNGTIPADNPFIKNDTAKHEIWSYGHRNPQGIAFEPASGKLYSSEHGPTHGDEINIIQKGKNYGWPVVHHRETDKNMVGPVMEFTPSIGPSQTIFYSGKAFPEMKGNLLVATMRGESILNINIKEQKITGYEYLLKNKYGRIRALTEGPDGYIYFSTSQVDPPESRLKSGDADFDMILCIRPAKPGDKNTEILSVLTPKKEAIFTQAPVMITSNANLNRSAVLYKQLCASCHGNDLEGKNNIPSLKDNKWINGGSKTELIKSLNDGIINKGMPAWKGVLKPQEIDKMADYILNY